MPALLHERRTLRFAMAASLLAALAACGAENDVMEIEAAAIVGQPLVVELGPFPIALSSLPSGAAIAGERVEWTPQTEHEGEHSLSLAIARDGIVEPIRLRVVVSPVDPSIEYGGCECGSKPRPPRPRAEAAGVVLLAAYFRQRRRAAALLAK